MKKKIVVGSLMAVFMVMMPSISSVEYDPNIVSNSETLFNIRSIESISNNKLSGYSSVMILNWIAWLLTEALPQACFLLYYIVARILGIEAIPEKI